MLNAYIVKYFWRISVKDEKLKLKQKYILKK